MPGGNGTGPAGAGPMTGRGAGFCAGYVVPGYANPVGGRGCGGYGIGYGRGGGRGRGGWGRGNWIHATGAGWQGAAQGFAAPNSDSYAAGYAAPTREQQADILRQQSQHLEGQLDGIKKRLKDLEDSQ